MELHLLDTKETLLHVEKDYQVFKNITLYLSTTINCSRIEINSLFEISFVNDVDFLQKLSLSTALWRFITKENVFMLYIVL